MQKIATLIIITTALFFSHIATSQTTRAYEKRAAERFAEKDYSQALVCYQVLLDADTQRFDLYHRAGFSALQLQAYPLAQQYLARIPEEEKKGDRTDTDLLLGLAFKGLGQYEDAMDAFFQFLATQPGSDKALLDEANREIENCQWAKVAVKNPTPTQIQRLPDDLNSTAADFAPVRFADRLYFTSAGQNDSLDVLDSRLLSSANGEAPVLVAGIDDDSLTQTSNFAITQDAQRIYFTRCQASTVPGELACRIWYCDRNKTSGEWDKPRLLPPFINLDGANTTQPTIGYDQVLKKNVLYFVSNRPGGVGGNDIWASVQEENGEFGKPVCLTINTPLDEATPSFHATSQMLFFSSNGHHNLGGFDVNFTKKGEDGQWEAPKNMGLPVNSSYDDLYYTFHSPSQSAYFASNRPGGKCDSPEGYCTCQDIYLADVKVGLEVFVFSDVDSAELAGAKVEITNLNTGKVDSVFVNKESNRFTFPLELDQDYRIRATCPRYLPMAGEVSTRAITYFDMLRKDLYLTPGALLATRTLNAIDKSPITGVKIDLTDNKTGQSRTVENNQYSYTNQFRLDFDRTYDVLASKPKFASGNRVVSTLGMVEGDTIFLDLLISPFEGLPLVLYFDNGQPLSLSPEDSSAIQVTYGETVQGYMARKPVFLKGYSTGLKSKQQRKEATEQVEQFFADSVLANYDRLVSFSPLLLNYLSDSNFQNRIEILFAGFASPLGDSLSNQRLTRRRVQSLINHFRTWNNGVLMPYLDSGQLQINLDPRGEELNPEVSDDPLNPRSAVFSPQASRMRRVLITEIRTMPMEGDGMQ